MFLNCKKISIFLAALTLCAYVCNSSAFAFERTQMTLNYDGKNHQYNAEEIFITVNGKPVDNLIMPPISLNNRTLVPAREVFESLGAEVLWDNPKQEVTVIRGEDHVVLAINKESGAKNGKIFKMDVAPKIINSKTMIPVRYAAEALDCEVIWDAESRTVVINDSDIQKPTQNHIIKTTVLSDNKIQIEAAEPIKDYKNIYLDDTRIVLDFHDAINELEPQNTLSDNKFVSAIRTSQYETDVSRVVLDLTTNAKHTITESDDKTKLIVTFDPATVTENPAEKPTETPVDPPVDIPTETPVEFKNFSYDPNTNCLALNKKQPIDVNRIIHTDNYLKHQYILTLPGDYFDTYGDGTFPLSDDYLNSISISSDENGNTVFTFNEKRVLALNLTETNSVVNIEFVLPREKYEKIVILDPGHGGRTPGAVGNGITEKIANLQITTKIAKLFDESDIKVYCTRIDDTFSTLADRAEFANEIGDLFVSIHHNSSESPKPNGLEVLYTPHANETVDKLTSKKAAQHFQEKLIEALGFYDRKIKDSPQLGILNRTTIPAVLIEVGFLSNPEEAAILRTEECQNTIAETVYNGICEILSENIYR